MKLLVNSREMKQCDTNTTEYFKVPSMVLMERAALSVADEIERRNIDKSRCLVVCGMGNNGGDGLAIARILYQRGSQVTVVCDMKEEKATQQVKQQFEIVRQYGIPVIPHIPGPAEPMAEPKEYTLIVDAIFGIGLSRDIQGHWKEDIEALNQRKGYKVAVDIPSGICGDDGQVLGCAFRADLTVTFAYMKTGLLLYPGQEYAGEIVTADIGIDEYSFRDMRPSGFYYEKCDLCRLPERKPDSNKGTYGHVLVIAGSKNMAGAAFFSGKAAAVTGCGLVQILTVEENRVILQQKLPEAILTTYTEEETGTEAFHKKLEKCIRWADVIVTGPGLGTQEAAARIVDIVRKTAGCPVIFDADALNLLAKEPEKLKNTDSRFIVTPHMGEMSRLTGRTIGELKKDPVMAAQSFAKDYHVVCVLKDARTVTAYRNGTYFVNTSGNHGMATAGSGDVLTGIIAGLLAQGMPEEEAASFGVFLHGMAGDAMVAATGYYGMLACDIIEGIRQITRKEARHEYLQQSICSD